MKLVSVVIACTVFGCTSENVIVPPSDPNPDYYRHFIDPAGHDAVMAQCHKEPDCWAMVGNQCSAGYVILDDKSLRSDVVANGLRGIHPGASGIIAVECKETTSDCSPPYNLIDGIRRWKRECLSLPKKVLDNE